MQAKAAQKNYFRPSGIPFYRNLFFGVIAVLKKILPALSIVAAAVLIILCMHTVGENAASVMSDSAALPTVIVDAGHGGFDGGCSGGDGTLEKDINLAVAMKTGEMLTAMGYDVVYVRTEDTAVGDGGSSTREKKQNDLKYRFSLMQEYPDSIYLCIHQNYFGGSSSHGAQMFFAPSAEGSKELALALQDAFITTVQPDNKRAVKQCTDDVYIIYNAPTTAVLVECGFLSNPTDLANLKSDEYQSKTAFAICCGLQSYISRS